MERILIASPVRQDPRILAEFLTSLLELETPGLTVDFAFVDDNDSPASRELLHDFGPGRTVRLLPGTGPGPAYEKNDFTHIWQEELVWRVAAYKDTLIRVARQGHYDGLFLVDSDLVLHPRTLSQLIAANVDIISEIFWTKWQPDEPELPQVWLRDAYTLYQQARGERLSPGDAERRQQGFLSMLRRPGIYEVGGLGACTLISRRALEKGVCFREIPNLSFVGEDRHFCIRAAALGLKLYADTHFPALHLYRERDLAQVARFKAAHARRQSEIDALDDCKQVLRADRGHLLWGVPMLQEEGLISVEGALLQPCLQDGTPARNHVGFRALLAREEDRWSVTTVETQPKGTPSPPVPFVRKTRNNRVTLSMLVRNEADRHLRTVLQHAASYIDAAVIVDDGSTDGTVALCREILREIPHVIHSLGNSQFHIEHKLRRTQWELTEATNPDWVLLLDADELFESRMESEIRGLIDQDEADVICFRLYDFWDDQHYREDEYWMAHRVYRPFLVRCNPNTGKDWPEQPVHCGRFPWGIWDLPRTTSDIRLKHLGWSRPGDRQEKYERYMKADPEGTYGILAQYQSILDPQPRLVRWEE